MKITILALHLGYGGIEKFITNITNMLEENNEVEIISTYKLYDEPAFYISPNVKITYLLEKLKPNKQEINESIKNLKILELIKQLFIAVKVLYLKKHKMKSAIKSLDSEVVISTRDIHNKLLSKYGKKNTIKIATEHNYKDTDKPYMKKVINSCKNVDYLVIASKELADMYKSNMTNIKCKVVNIPLSVDYIPTRTSKLEEKSITYIGRLSKEKGVIDLIEVFNKVYKKDNEFILNIIGAGSEEEQIISKIKEHNLEKNVIIHGYKTKEAIEEILLKTSIGINTSYTESFGLAILETFSYGIPCVAFDSAKGAREIIDNNKNGYIIEKRNFEEMANSILELFNNKEKLSEFGKNAREKSLKYEQKVIKEEWLKLLISK